MKQLTPTQEKKAVQYGFILGILGLLSGSMLLCDCAGWFVCSAAAFVAPVLYGHGWRRKLGIVMLIFSLAIAVLEFGAERKLENNLQHLRDSAQTNHVSILGAAQ